MPDVRHRHDELGHRRRDLAERLDGRLAGFRIAVEDEHDRQRRLAVELGRDERRRRRRHEERDGREGLGRARRDRAEAAQDLAGRRHEQRAAEDHPDREEPELEAGHDTEVAAAATHGPEEVAVLRLARRDDTAVGGHDLDRHERVDGQAVLAHEPADAATEGQPGDADAAGVAEWGRETVGAGRGRVLAGGQARLRPGETSLGVDVQALHGAEVEDDAAVARAVAGEAVRAAADRQLEAGVAREQHRPDDVRRAGGPHDQRGVPIVVPVLDEPRDVVAFVVGRITVPVIPALKAADVGRAGGVVGRRAGEGHRGRILSGGSPGGGGR